MEKETGTSEAREAPAEQPDVVVSPSRQEEINTTEPSEGGQPAPGGTATGPKKRRRGRRGGKRHRRKTPGTGTTTAEQPSPDGEAGSDAGGDASADGAKPAPKPRAPRAPRPQGQQRQPRQRQPRPAATKSAATEAGAAAETPTNGDLPEAETTLANDAESEVATTDGSPTAPRRRRRRGGRGRGKKPAGQGQQAATDGAEPASKAE